MHLKRTWRRKTILAVMKNSNVNLYLYLPARTHNTTQFVIANCCWNLLPFTWSPRWTNEHLRSKLDHTHTHTLHYWRCHGDKHKVGYRARQNTWHHVTLSARRENRRVQNELGDFAIHRMNKLANFRQCIAGKNNQFYTAHINNIMQACWYAQLTGINVFIITNICFESGQTNKMPSLWYYASDVCRQSNILTIISIPTVASTIHIQAYIQKNSAHEELHLNIIVIVDCVKPSVWLVDGNKLTQVGCWIT